ncbi:MAG: hypothetical protein ACR2KV_15250 [Solirubrobacteraceae bacterium]
MAAPVPAAVTAAPEITNATDGDNVQAGDQSAPDTSTNAPEATASGSEASSPSDGPGGHQDGPGNVDYTAPGDSPNAP